jgi:hypothetical protein
VPLTHLVPESDTDAATGRRERRARRVASPAEPLDFDARRAARRARRESSATEPVAAEAITPDVADPDGTAMALEAQHADGEAHWSASGQRRSRPRAPQAEKRAAADAASAGDGAEPVSESAGLPEGSAAPAAALAGTEPGTRPSRGTRTLQRAQRKAAAAVEGADEHPALGALNRHLNLLMQQLGTAHRVIGRVAAERDALRQQLADLQGIPVDEIVVTSISANDATKEKEDRPARTRGHAEPGEPQPSTGLARFNYFAHDDIQVMRKRRQMLALVLLGMVLVIWLIIRMGFLQMPDKLSRDSLGALPVIGNFMSIFFAGWMFFRVFRIGGKGVKWIFPSDQRRKRR